MTVEILNFTEALRLTDTGKRIIKAKQHEKIMIQIKASNESNTP